MLLPILHCMILWLSGLWTGNKKHFLSSVARIKRNHQHFEWREISPLTADHGCKVCSGDNRLLQDVNAELRYKWQNMKRRQSGSHAVALRQCSRRHLLQASEADKHHETLGIIAIHLIIRCNIITLTGSSSFSLLPVFTIPRSSSPARRREGGAGAGGPGSEVACQYLPLQRQGREQQAPASGTPGGASGKQSVWTETAVPGPQCQGCEAEE